MLCPPAQWLTLRSVVDILRLAAPLAYHLPPFLRLPLLLFLQLLGGLLPQEKLEKRDNNNDDLPCWLTLSFFFLSGVMKPFLAFLPAAWASSLARTSAFFLSISACFLAWRAEIQCGYNDTVWIQWYSVDTMNTLWYNMDTINALQLWYNVDTLSTFW